MWEWLIEHVAIPGIHGSGDGAAFVRVVRLWSRCCECDERVKATGVTMSNSRRATIHPYARLSRDLWAQLGSALDQIGATPGSRYKVAGPRTSPHGTHLNDWDDID